MILLFFPVFVSFLSFFLSYHCILAGGRARHTKSHLFLEAPCEVCYYYIHLISKRNKGPEKLVQGYREMQSQTLNPCHLAPSLLYVSALYFW